MPEAANPVRRALGVLVIASVALSLFAPVLHARPGDPMGCAEHHMMVAGPQIVSMPHTGCAATPDACHLMLGCGVVTPALAVPPLAFVPAAAPIVVRTASAVSLTGLPGFGPPTPPPNS